jgi:hypothetical protein
MPTVVRYLLIVAAVAAVVYALDRLGLYVERRGWVYYRQKRGSVPLATAVLETQALFDPSKRHVLEATRTDADESESAGPPNGGA